MVAAALSSPRATTNPVYYHRADARGIGFDRTRTSLNRLPLPAGSPPPADTLDHYRALAFPHAPGQGG